MNSKGVGPDEVYAFAMRGWLAEESLDRAGRKKRINLGFHGDESVSKALSISLLDAELVGKSRRMALVYTSVSAFENSVRELVASSLAEEHGETWWTKCVSDKIRGKAESRMKEEERYKWHTPRGNIPINFTDFGELASIIQQNWQSFEPLLQSVAWVENIFKTLERSRNVIMHSGELDQIDIERIGIHIRDWVKQVGT